MTDPSARSTPMVGFRQARPADAQSIARLHSDSWRRHYRGAYADTYLDGDVATERLAVWRSRLEQPHPRAWTVLAVDDEEVIGFAHVMFNEDATFGCLLDNLHVAGQRQRRGVGTSLLALTAEEVVERRSGLFLWVLEQNQDAQAFYAAHGGRCWERNPASPPGGQADRLAGTPMMLRYIWPAERLTDLALLSR